MPSETAVWLASAMPKLIEAANKTDSKDTGARAALATAFKNMGDAGSSRGAEFGADAERE